MRHHLLTLFFATSCLAGCGTLDPEQTIDRGNVLLNGGGANINTEELKKYSDNQDQYLVQFARNGGVQVPLDADHHPNFSGFKPADWSNTTNAGVIYVSQQCEDYLHAIWELNRARHATSTEISSLGAFMAAVLGATQASTSAIAITASAFGFASATSENLYSSVLYQLEPSGVVSLVHASQAAVKSSISDNEKADLLKTRNDSVAAIAQYLNVCLPQTIEANVNSAVKNAAVTVPAASASQSSGGASHTASVPTTTSPALAAPNVQVNAPAATPQDAQPQHH